MSLKGLSQLIEKLQYKSLKTHHGVFLGKKNNDKTILCSLFSYNLGFVFSLYFFLCASFISYFYIRIYVDFSAGMVK